MNRVCNRELRSARQRAPEGVLDHGMLPDPEAQEINDLKQRVTELENLVRTLLVREDHSMVGRR